MFNNIGFMDKEFSKRRIEFFPGFESTLSPELLKELEKVDRSSYHYGDFVIGYKPGVFRIVKIYEKPSSSKDGGYFVDLFSYMDEYGNVIPMEKGSVHREDFNWCLKIDEQTFDERMKAIQERMAFIKATLFTAKAASEK